MNQGPDLKKHLGADAKLLACSVGKLINLGGFDMKAAKPKPMFKATPAGSVFFFELNEEIELDQFQGKKISDEFVQQGFGIAYFGTFKMDK
jgi:CRISPR-associated protein Cmr3